MADNKCFEKVGYHSHIVKYLMAWDEEHVVHNVVQLSQTSLADYINHTSNVSEMVYFDCIQDICVDLKFLADKGIAHLDVKADNIPIHGKFFKLSDFGNILDIKEACRKIITPTDCSKLECSGCKTTWHGVCAQPQPLNFSLATLLIWKYQNCTTEADASTMHFNAIMAQLTNLSNAIATFNTQMSDLHNLVNSQSTKINDCISEIAVLWRENEQLKIKIQKIESTPPENVPIENKGKKMFC
ncbi:uncharacterized protein LOC126891500 [Diabrotica virgifera virgifera]|uniref:Protein kinase domain-containing protein n=1 Tax=Diabrotica virgifera virgifera TaxID=50390 RepID=A0ABM5L2G3_DIAVI|nr:uncharacterized protein LOC126891500 [Diabrotica virgifera virgifera]